LRTHFYGNTLIEGVYKYTHTHNCIGVL